MSNKQSLPLRGKTYKVKNMHCASCASMIELELEDMGIAAKCSYAKEELELEDKNADEEKIIEAVKSAGYELVI